MLNVLFVCLGNICRSPMAEAIFKDLIKKRNLEKYFYVDSAGTQHYHIGEKSDSRGLSTLKKHGIDFIHFARQINNNDRTKFDYILAMEDSVLEILKSKFSNSGSSNLLMMREFDKEAESDDLNVPDPWYGKTDGFEEVYQILLRCNMSFLEYLIEKHKINVTA